MPTIDQLVERAGKRVDGYKKRAVKSVKKSVKSFNQKSKKLIRKRKQSMWDKLIDQAKSNLDKQERDWKQGLPKKADEATTRFKKKMEKCPHCGKLNCKGH